MKAPGRRRDEDSRHGCSSPVVADTVPSSEEEAGDGEENESEAELSLSASIWRRRALSYMYMSSPLTVSTLLENLSLVPVGNPRFVPVSRPVPLLRY